MIASIIRLSLNALSEKRETVNRDTKFNMTISKQNWSFKTISDLYKNPLPFQERGQIIKQIKLADFSTNQNAAKLQLFISVYF